MSSEFIYYLYVEYTPEGGSTQTARINKLCLSLSAPRARIEYVDPDTFQPLSPRSTTQVSLSEVTFIAEEDYPSS